MRGVGVAETLEGHRKMRIPMPAVAILLLGAWLMLGGDQALAPRHPDPHGAALCLEHDPAALGDAEATAGTLGVFLGILQLLERDHLLSYEKLAKSTHSVVPPDTV